GDAEGAGRIRNHAAIAAGDGHEYALEPRVAHRIAHVPGDRSTGRGREASWGEDRERGQERTPSHGSSNSHRSALRPTTASATSRFPEADRAGRRNSCAPADTAESRPEDRSTRCSIPPPSRCPR